MASIKLELDCFGAKDGFWESKTLNNYSFAMFPARDKEKVESGKIRIKGLQLSPEAARGLRDHLTVYIDQLEKQIKEEKKNETKSKKVSSNTK